MHALHPLYLSMDMLLERCHSDLTQCARQAGTGGLRHSTDEYGAGGSGLKAQDGRVGVQRRSHRDVWESLRGAGGRMSARGQERPEGTRRGAKVEWSAVRGRGQLGRGVPRRASEAWLGRRWLADPLAQVLGLIIAATGAAGSHGPISRAHPSCLPASQVELAMDPVVVPAGGECTVEDFMRFRLELDQELDAKRAELDLPEVDYEVRRRHGVHRVCLVGQVSARILTLPKVRHWLPSIKVTRPVQLTSPNPPRRRP